MGARLFVVADALDAIASDRLHREELTFGRAKAEILSGSGAQFDPSAVAAFVAEDEALRHMVASKCMQAQAEAGFGSGAWSSSIVQGLHRAPAEDCTHSPSDAD